MVIALLGILKRAPPAARSGLPQERWRAPPSRRPLALKMLCAALEATPRIVDSTADRESANRPPSG
jgi:hypothetical protein